LPIISLQAVCDISSRVNVNSFSCIYLVDSGIGLRLQNTIQEAQLSQRDRETRCVSKFVLCFTK